MKMEMGNRGVREVQAGRGVMAWENEEQVKT